MCTGAYLLAAAGLLDDRRATSHWAHCDDLARRYARVQVDPDPVFIHDGEVWTSAGITAGIDLALALVEEDVGPEAALVRRSRLVVFLKRPGGQSQFSSALSAQQATRPELRELQAWISGHLEENLSVPVLAERALMSERSFTRAFHREVGQSPAAYVETLRIERARDLLEDGAPSLEAVAQPPDSPAPKYYAARFTATSASHPPNTATASSSAASSTQQTGDAPARQGPLEAGRRTPSFAPQSAMTVFPRACPSPWYRRASGTSLKA